MDTVECGAGSSSGTSLRSHARAWGLWSVPPRAWAFIIGIEFVLCLLTVLLLLREHLVAIDVARAALLIGLSTAFSETANRVELLRRYLHLGDKDRTWSNPTSVWTFAAALLLPAGYAVAVVLTIYGHILFRSRRHRTARPYRIVFSGATTILGVYAAIAIQGLIGIRLIHDSAFGAIAALLALVVYTAVSLCATVTAAYLVRQPPTVRDVLPGTDAVGFEVATLVLGVITAEFMLGNPWLIPGVFVLIAVLHRSALVKELETAASTDTKTGLLTAGAWHDMAGRHLARASRAGEPAALLMIDLDHFKRVNDEFGHLAGDQMLRSVANCLKTELRGYDALGRFGGEEFVAVLDGVGKDAAVSIAVRLAEAISALKSAAAGEHDLPSRLTASIGVASFPADGTSVDALTAAADTALYEAKGDGRNCVRHIEEIAPVS